MCIALCEVLRDGWKAGDGPALLALIVGHRATRGPASDPQLLRADRSTAAKRLFWPGATAQAIDFAALRAGRRQPAGFRPTRRWLSACRTTRRQGPRRAPAAWACSSTRCPGTRLSRSPATCSRSPRSPRRARLLRPRQRLRRQPPPPRQCNELRTGRLAGEPRGRGAAAGAAGGHLIIIL